MPSGTQAAPWSRGGGFRDAVPPSSAGLVHAAWDAEQGGCLPLRGAARVEYMSAKNRRQHLMSSSNCKHVPADDSRHAVGPSSILSGRQGTSDAGDCGGDRGRSVVLQAFGPRREDVLSPLGSSRKRDGLLGPEAAPPSSSTRCSSSPDSWEPFEWRASPASGDGDFASWPAAAAAASTASSRWQPSASRAHSSSASGRGPASARGHGELPPSFAAISGSSTPSAPFAAMSGASTPSVSSRDSAATATYQRASTAYGAKTPRRGQSAPRQGISRPFSAHLAATSRFAAPSRDSIHDPTCHFISRA